MNKKKLKVQIPLEDIDNRIVEVEGKKYLCITKNFNKILVCKDLNIYWQPHIEENLGCIKNNFMHKIEKSKEGIYINIMDFSLFYLWCILKGDYYIEITNSLEKLLESFYAIIDKMNIYLEKHPKKEYAINSHKLLVNAIINNIKEHIQISEYENFK